MDTTVSWHSSISSNPISYHKQYVVMTQCSVHVSPSPCEVNNVSLQLGVWSAVFAALTPAAPPSLSVFERNHLILNSVCKLWEDSVPSVSRSASLSTGA